MKRIILLRNTLCKIENNVTPRYSLKGTLAKNKNFLNKTTNKFIIVFLLIIIVTFSFIQSGCKDNGVSPQQNTGDTTWVECEGLPFTTGIAANGNTLVAGNYDAYLSKAYVYISFDNGLNWALDAQFQVDNHNPFTHLYVSTPVTFLSYAGRLFAGIDGGHTGAIYISTNNGISWNNKGISWPLGDTLFGGNGICFAALGQDIFAGTGYGVFRSTDKGSTWLSVNKGLTYDHFDSIYAHPPEIMSILAHGNDIYAGTQGGVFLSSDFGTNWSPINSGLSSLTIVGLTTNQTNIFAGAFPFTSDSIGGVFLYQSSDETWKAVNNGLTDHRVNAVASIGTYVFAGTNTGLYISSNEGISWSYDSIGVPPQTLAVTYLAVINSHLYVGTLHGVWRYPISRLPKAVEGNESDPSRIKKGG
jgi:ligand-binding sensor domain-containing protein